MLFEQKSLLQKINWDNLIILDACRFDTFINVWGLSVPVLAVLSPASWTLEWLDRVFGNVFVNAVVFSSTPYINSIYEINLYGIHWNPREHFRKIIDLWLTAWDNKLGTVPPGKVYLSVNAYLVLTKRSGKDNVKKIIWFLQPHYPYLSELITNIISKYIEETTFKDFISGKLDRLLRHITLSIAKIDINSVKKAYEENLSLVLNYVYKLVNKLDGTIIVTSDHGELLGECIWSQIISTIINLIRQSIEDRNTEYLRRRITMLSYLMNIIMRGTRILRNSFIGSQYITRYRAFFHPPIMYSTTLRKVPFVIIK